MNTQGQCGCGLSCSRVAIGVVDFERVEFAVSVNVGEQNAEFGESIDCGVVLRELNFVVGWFAVAPFGGGAGSYAF